MNRRAFLFAVPVMLAPERSYLICGYGRAGQWACEITGADGLQRVRAGLAFGSVQTWVSADQWDGKRWVPMDGYEER